MDDLARWWRRRFRRGRTQGMDLAATLEYATDEQQIRDAVVRHNEEIAQDAFVSRTTRGHLTSMLDPDEVVAEWRLRRA
jgi:hypothetical protein